MLSRQHAGERHRERRNARSLTILYLRYNGCMSGNESSLRAAMMGMMMQPGMGMGMGLQQPVCALYDGAQSDTRLLELS